ncbi:condensin complex component SMC4 [Xylaria sp. FL1042]|nr:condensin complex component SMC4 [Xylaria sp. FL1042]
MATRSSRRVAATRRAAIIESSDEEDDVIANTTVKKIKEESEDEFDPEAASQSSRRQSQNRRKSAAPATPRRGRPRKSVAPESSVLESSILESTEVPDAEESSATILPPESPAKKPSPRKRKSVAPRKTSASAEPTPDTQPSSIPTPAPSEKPSEEPSEHYGTPLADITSHSVNEPSTPSDETVTQVKPIRPLDTILEKPMDIVLKSRQMAMPVVEETGPKARIVITYLILNNFKSYAGRQEVGPFHASFSSVVGPNGSGKSNVIDSLLFVFGFRASKMRQGKISALIHNSAAYPDLDHCEVAVHFQEVMDLPGGGSEVIPDSQLVISRKAFKNNSSKYYINGRESNFTIVTTLLRDRGVDLDHKRFLILQGEAGNEHEDGLLEYLEDIIGTSKYKTPIEEAATDSGRVQHKNKALAYIRDENDLALKQSALYQLYISECNDNMQAQLDAELEKHQGSEHIIKQLQKAYSKGSKDFEAQEKTVQSLVKEASKFEQERVKFDEKRKFLTDKQKKLEKTIANAEKSAEEADETIEQCTEEIASRAEELVNLEQRVQEEEAELATIRESLKGKTQVFSDQIAVKQKSLEPWQEKINQKQSAIAVAESEMTILAEKANAGAVALEEMKTKITSIEEGRAAKLAELEECQAEKAKLEQEAKEVEAEIDNLAKMEPRVREKVSRARQRAEEARSSLSQTQNRGNVLTALMRMKESGRIDGFHGRLGNLGTIDEKYDVAISTACGALDNFVTDTVEAGQQCIEYLRKTNLGRGNFMCLDKLRVRDIQPIQTPEGAPRLFDLVKAKEEKFRPAFYHALQDTLVAKDLAQANRIAYGARRWRVVTLDGELIDKSGTMSGGGKTVKRGLMSSKLVADTTQEEVVKLESDRDNLDKRFQEFLDEQREQETRLRDLQDRIPRLDTKMQKIRLEVQSAEKNMADAQRRIKELSKEHQPSESDDNRKAALEKEIAKLNKEVSKLHAETEGVEAEIKELQDKIMEVGGEKLRAQRAMVDTLKEEISSHNEETSNAEVKKVKAEKSKTKLQKDHAKATKELEAAAKDLEQLKEEIENQGTKSESLNAQVEAAEEALGEKKQELASMKAELDEKTSELNETRASEIEMRNQLEENQKALVENQKRLRYWNEKLGKLVLQNVSDLMGNVPAKKPAENEAQEPAETNVEEQKPEQEQEDEDEDEQEKQQEQRESTPEEQPEEFPRFTEDELRDMSKEALKAEIAALEEKTQNVNVDVSVLAEYRRRVEEHSARSSDLASAVQQRDSAKKRCDDLRRLRLEGFMEGFSTISLRLKEMYQMITMGGNAELELVDSLDPFSEGILFSVMPPKKSWKNISNLSGGEKTLSSLALVFALHHYKPTPLYVMDEIDAALDFRNVSIVANYIKERTKNAQFIVISLRNNMFELAARLVGVYKVNHMTKSVTIENRDFIARSAVVRPGGLGGGGVTTTVMR